MDDNLMQAARPLSFARALVAALALCASGVAAAQWWDPGTPQRRPPSEPRNSPYVYKRTADIGRASVQVQRALQAGDIAKVEKMHDEFLALQQAGGNGRWMMQSVGLAFDLALPAIAKDPARLRSFLADLKERFPDSTLRPSLEASAWMASGWNHRGHGYASTVSPEAMKLFREDHARALAALQEGEARGKGSPLWYQAAMSIAGVTGQPPAVLDAIFEEGATRYPLDQRLYDTRLNFLLPQWGGSVEGVDAFIRRAVLRTQATEGTSLYATLYYRVRRGRPEKDFFGGTKASWRTMRHAFEDGIVLEGDEEWLNTYGTFACIAEDHVTLRRLTALLGQRADFGMGLDGVSPEVCAEMARR
jgi:hypothetical protein